MVTKKQRTVRSPMPISEPHGHGVLTVGLDIGYGATKAVMPIREPIIFPSVFGRARDLNDFERLSISQKAAYIGEQLTDDEGDWLVGRLAQSQLKTAEQLVLRGRSANETDDNVSRVRLAKVALGKLLSGTRNGVAIHVRIATGLPVDHMNGAAELKTALIGLHHIQTDAADFVANIVEVIVMPQPYGTLYSQQLTAAGEYDPCFTATRAAVIDVGTFTIDAALDQDGEYIGAESGSVEGGVHLAQTRLISTINRDYKDTASLAEADDILRTRCIRVKGKVRNVTLQVEDALQPIRESTIALMGKLWQTARRIDVIYLTGGGATDVQAAVIAAGYSQAVLVDEPQTANARGYLNYALFKDNA